MGTIAVVAEDAIVLALKALNGGLFVVGFALVAQALKPKRFAGVFSAAPSIAMANLLVAVIANGHGEGVANADGMLIGAGAMTLACLAGILLVRQRRSLRGSAGVCVLWLILSIAGYVAIEL
jgi:Protein of unknown function (DUF3147)